jgi:hypothetical protein
MRIIRFRGFISFAVTSVALIGCSSVGRFDADAPRSVDLSGAWILDHGASEDPQKLFDKLRPKAPEPHRGYDDGSGLGDPSIQGPPQGGQQGGGQRGGRRSSQQASNNPGYRNNDGFVRVSVMRTLSATLARGEQMTIRQTPDAFSLDYGSSVRTFTPGGKSVVSADWGVADQSSGWKGKAYTVQFKPQAGVAVIETYSLADEGKHLIEELKLGGGDFPVVRLKRVFDHSDKALPRAFPSND